MISLSFSIVSLCMWIFSFHVERGNIYQNLKKVEIRVAHNFYSASHNLHRINGFDGRASYKLEIQVHNKGGMEIDGWEYCIDVKIGNRSIKEYKNRVGTNLKSGDFDRDFENLLNVLDIVDELGGVDVLRLSPLLIFNVKLKRFKKHFWITEKTSEYRGFFDFKTGKCSFFENKYGLIGDNKLDVYDSQGGIRNSENKCVPGQYGEWPGYTVAQERMGRIGDYPNMFEIATGNLGTDYVNRFIHRFHNRNGGFKDVYFTMTILESDNELHKVKIIGWGIENKESMCFYVDGGDKWNELVEYTNEEKIDLNRNDNNVGEVVLDRNQISLGDGIYRDRMFRYGNEYQRNNFSRNEGAGYIYLFPINGWTRIKRVVKH